MNTFLELKKMVEAQNAPKPILTKKQRDIREIEKSLTSLPKNIQFGMTLAELNPAQKNETIPPHQYQRENYQLNILNENGKYLLVLENVLAKKSKKLMECPEHLQQICLDNIENFLRQLLLSNPQLEKLESNTDIEVEYADNGEQDYSL